MLRSLRYVLPLGLFVVLAVFLWRGLGLSPTEVPSPLIGKPAPAFSLARLDDRTERLSRTVPMFRQRVAETPSPAPPRWEYDADFDLDYHLRRVSAPATKNRPISMTTLSAHRRLITKSEMPAARNEMVPKLPSTA